jgi:hypothetical protein
MRSRTVNILLVAGSVLVALVAIEAALRFANLYPPPDDPIKPGQPELFQPDPVLGYRLQPSRTTTYEYPRGSGRQLTVAANSDGFRSDREFSGGADDRRRILVVGDSFVFGLGVAAQERITEQLEALEPAWRVDNLGMTGWGVDLMIRAIEQVGPKPRPDVVVLAVYTDDFRRLLPYYAGAGYAIPKYELAGSKLVTVPYPYPADWERLRLVQWLYQANWNRDRNRFDLHAALLDRFLTLAETRGFRPVIAFLPGREDTEEDQARRAFLRQWSARHVIPFVDLTAAVQRAGVDSVYLAGNWHWNAAGHRLAAVELRQLLQRLPGPDGRVAKPTAPPAPQSGANAAR